MAAVRQKTVKSAFRKLKYNGCFRSLDTEYFRITSLPLRQLKLARVILNPVQLCQLTMSLLLHIFRIDYSECLSLFQGYLTRRIFRNTLVMQFSVTSFPYRFKFINHWGYLRKLTSFVAFLS